MSAATRLRPNWIETIGGSANNESIHSSIKPHPSAKIHRNRFHDRPARGRPRQEILIITEESYDGIGILTDCSFSLELKEGGRGRLPRISFGGQVLSLKYLAAKTIQTTSKRRHGLRVGNNGPRSALSLRDPPSPYISSSRAVQPSNYYFSGAFVSLLSQGCDRDRGEQRRQMVF